MAPFPDTKIEQVQEFSFARDDLLPGGTKRRALIRYLPSLNQTSFIYVGSVYGSGGWALAEACRDLGYGCKLVLSKSPYSPPWLENIDCEIEWRDPQPVDQIYASLGNEPGLLPLGFDDPAFIGHMADVFRKIDMHYPEIWMSCVSGTLIRSMQAAWPDIKINAVCVARHHGDLGAATKYQAPEKYHQAANTLPPYPANAFSDAKLWQFLREFALKDALIWNTSS